MNTDWTVIHPSPLSENLLRPVRGAINPMNTMPQLGEEGAATTKDSRTRTKWTHQRPNPQQEVYE